MENGIYVGSSVYGYIANGWFEFSLHYAVRAMNSGTIWFIGFVCGLAAGYFIENVWSKK
jgi:hypothetical protein